MGPIKANLELSNASQASLKSIQVICLVDTGALHLCIPEHVALQLGFDLHSTERRVVTLADGKKHLVAYVGPVKVRFEKRSCYVGALVLGDETLLGECYYTAPFSRSNPSNIKTRIYT